MTDSRKALRSRLFGSFLVMTAMMGPIARLAADEEVLPEGVPGTPAAVAPAPVAPAPMGLQELINLGMEKQPALAAARASLAAAQSGQQGVNGIILGRLFAPDLPIRRQQACLGVTIAQAALFQAEWETRYAVTRNYYSIQYAREQQKLLLRVKDKLEKAHERAKVLVKSGDPDIKVSQIDVDVLGLNVDLIKVKEAEANVGLKKAFAALREAIGLGLDCPLEVINEPLPALVSGFNKQELIDVALAKRGELTQVSAALRVTELEIDAQGKSRFAPTKNTFAAASDIHAQPIPQGVANGEYRPGAIGLEYPGMLVGKRNDRMQRARDLSDRAGAVVDKTTNLITLEVEATYLKWEEAATKLNNLAGAPKKSQDIYKNVQEKFDTGKVSGETLLRAQTMEDQIVAQYNEALYLHALALAALERVTAGGYCITRP